MTQYSTKYILDDNHRQGLEELARMHGYVKSAKNNDSSPNVSAMLRAIALGDIELVTVGATSLVPQWQQLVGDYIEAKQPFAIAYCDLGGNAWNYTVRYAEFRSRNYRPGKARLYLDCWCEETHGNVDIPELQHNWALRPDRISELAAIDVVEGEWYGNLDYIEVEMSMYGGLAHGYEGNDDDIESVRNGDVRYVSRRVTSTYWFMRDIMPYGALVRVVSPTHMVARVKGEVEKMMGYY